MVAITIGYMCTSIQYFIFEQSSKLSGHSSLIKLWIFTKTLLRKISLIDNDFQDLKWTKSYQKRISAFVKTPASTPTHN